MAFDVAWSVPHEARVCHWAAERSATSHSSSRGSVEGSGSSTVGPAFATGTGVVNLGGGSSEGRDGWRAIRNYPVTLPSITTVRVVDGDKALPVSLDRGWTLPVRTAST